MSPKVIVFATEQQQKAVKNSIAPSYASLHSNLPVVARRLWAQDIRSLAGYRFRKLTNSMRRFTATRGTRG